MKNETRLERAIGWLAISSCFLLLVVPLLYADGGAYIWDQDNYHVPAIHQIRRHWPSIDLDEDVLSAAAPGYHWFLAGVSLLLGDGLPRLRAINLAVSFLVLAVLYRWLRKHFNPVHGALLLAPLATSNFFIKSSAWLVTDNASLLLVATALIGVFGPSTRSRLGMCGLAAAAAVFVRQTNIWLIGPLLLCWHESVQDGKASYDRGRRASDLFCILSSTLVLGWLFANWHGLVPPRWQGASVKFSFSGIAYLSVVFLLFSVFYFGGKVLAQEIGRLDRRTFLFASGIGLLIATISPTSYSYTNGRWGGYFWLIVGFVPSVGERSVFFLVLSPLGVLVAAGIWQMLRSRAGSNAANLWLISMLCWSATFLVNRQAFHRYFEPTILVFLVVAVALTASGRLGRRQLFRLALLAGGQTGVTLMTAWAKSF